MLANTSDINKYVSKVAVFHTNRFYHYVRIIDVERSRVRLSFLITPVSGGGMRWVQAKEIATIAEPPEVSGIDESDFYIPE